MTERVKVTLLIQKSILVESEDCEQELEELIRALESDGWDASVEDVSDDE
jgi:hypothetical protein